MKRRKRKIYAYVDESGQDTRGYIFIVSVLVLSQEKDFIQSELCRIEEKSGKNNLKWNKSRHNVRRGYIEALQKWNSLRGKIFFEEFSHSSKYIELTSYATAKAILKKSGSNYKATIFVDGFKKKEMEVFKRGLKDLQIKIKKVRTVKKDENNAFIRLVDSICGLVRDAREDNPWARDILIRFLKKKIVIEL